VGKASTDQEQTIPTDSDMALIVRLLFDIAGIRISETKRELVRARLRRRLEATGHGSYAAYLRHVQHAEAGELRQMVEALTTNETSFFREPAHFEVFSERLLGPGLEPLKVWSAACSTGEEPYSIAMRCLEERGRLKGREVRILATDIDSQVLGIARQGVYPEEAVHAVASSWPAKYFESEMRDSERGPGVRVRGDVRAMVKFAQLNLMGNWPMRGRFSAVFARNVMIYFDRSTRAWLGLRLARMLAPGGLLFIGHAESLGSPPGLASVQPSVYMRTNEPVDEPGARPR
jgi:chemotaxis protein methyltransferase CheR